MTTDSNDHERRWKRGYRSGASGAVYGMGLLGAWFYYLSTATSFMAGALGIIKGIFWPAVFVFEVFNFLSL
jgi:hypothetical protein